MKFNSVALLATVLLTVFYVKTIETKPVPHWPGWESNNNNYPPPTNDWGQQKSSGSPTMEQVNNLVGKSAASAQGSNPSAPAQPWTEGGDQKDGKADGSQSTGNVNQSTEHTTATEPFKLDQQNNLVGNLYGGEAGDEGDDQEQSGGSEYDDCGGDEGFTDSAQGSGFPEGTSGGHDEQSSGNIETVGKGNLRSNARSGGGAGSTSGGISIVASYYKPDGRVYCDGLDNDRNGGMTVALPNPYHAGGANCGKMISITNQKGETFSAMVVGKT